MPSSDPPHIVSSASDAQATAFLVDSFDGFRHNFSQTPVAASADEIYPDLAPGEPEPKLEVWGSTSVAAPAPHVTFGQVTEKLDSAFDAREARREAARLQTEARILRADAQSARDRAQAEATRRVEEARTRADQIEAAAYQAGFQQGEEAGRRLGEQKAESVLRRLQALVDETAHQQAQVLRDSEEELVKLALLIALQVIHRELRLDPAVILDTVRAGIDRLRQASRLTLHVSPQDFQFLEENMERLRALVPATASLNIEPDPALAQGGCRIVSNAGEVDATIETAVHKLVERVWGERHPAQGDL